MTSDSEFRERRDECPVLTIWFTRFFPDESALMSQHTNNVFRNFRPPLPWDWIELIFECRRNAGNDRQKEAWQFPCRNTRPEEQCKSNDLSEHIRTMRLNFKHCPCYNKYWTFWMQHCTSKKCTKNHIDVQIGMHIVQVKYEQLQKYVHTCIYIIYNIIYIIFKIAYKSMHLLWSQRDEDASVEACESAPRAA